MTVQDLHRPEPNRRLSIAPMLDYSTRHSRMFWRLLTPDALIYSEMITTGALLHNDPARFLDHSAAEQPLALQLGGSDPVALARCAQLAEQWEYQEVNLNCGCPSDRVQSGMFGACLMAKPELVADCVQAMQEATPVPVTVKHRIGIDEMEGYDELVHFVDTIAQRGCRTFIVHARKAWLQGLSPKQNREIPPLRYEMVHRLKQDFPQLEIILNGGLTTLDACHEQLSHVDGIMVGRPAYQNPYFLVELQYALFDNAVPMPTREQLLDRFAPYVAEQLQSGQAFGHLIKPLFAFYQGVPGARHFRRVLSDYGHRRGAGLEVLQQARDTLEQVSAQTRNDRLDDE